MKKIINLLLTSFIAFSFSSCGVAAYVGENEAYESDCSTNISIVLSHGIPYYYGGTLAYYLYNGVYYYPYRVGGKLYYHSYRRPLPPPTGYHHNDARPHFRRPQVARPSGTDHKFNNNRSYGRPNTLSSGRRPSFNRGGRESVGSVKNNRH